MPLTTRPARRRRIDLVTISHFDADHINGIVNLVRSRTSETLLLPYLPLWRRLMIALAEGIAEESALFEFFVDPATYLSNVDGTDIGEILFVPPAGPDDTADPAPEPVDPDGPIGSLDIDYGKLPRDAADEPQNAANRGARVAYLRPGGRIVIPDLWECARCVGPFFAVRTGPALRNFAIVFRLPRGFPKVQSAGVMSAM